MLLDTKGGDTERADVAMPLVTTAERHDDATPLVTTAKGPSVAMLYSDEGVAQLISPSLDTGNAESATGSGAARDSVQQTALCNIGVDHAGGIELTSMDFFF